MFKHIKTKIGEWIGICKYHKKCSHYKKDKPTCNVEGVIDRGSDYCGLYRDLAKKICETKKDNLLKDFLKELF